MTQVNSSRCGVLETLGGTVSTPPARQKTASRCAKRLLDGLTTFIRKSARLRAGIRRDSPACRDELSAGCPYSMR